MIIHENVVQRKWRSAILSQRTSGLTIVEYCKQNRLTRASFFLWRKRLGLTTENCQNPAAKQGFTRIKFPVPPENIPSVELKAVIETPNGYKVHAEINSAEELKSIFRVIQCL